VQAAAAERAVVQERRLAAVRLALRARRILARTQ
jgi:hypothetical protein